MRNWRNAWVSRQASRLSGAVRCLSLRAAHANYYNCFLMVDDLKSLRDDMTAFIEGHGMKRFFGYVDPMEVQCVKWGDEQPDSWKDFVELAKAAECSFITMHAWAMQRVELDELVEQLRDSRYASEEDREEARWLKAHLGQTGFIQLGFAYQGTMFVHETACEWYEHYERLAEMADEMAIMLDGDEHSGHGAPGDSRNPEDEF